jgi:hypothetical protein
MLKIHRLCTAHAQNSDGADYGKETRYQDKKKSEDENNYMTKKQRICLSKFTLICINKG